MKFLSILAAASLALAPMVASAGSMEKSSENSRPMAGPTSVEPLDDDGLPAAALFAGGTVILAGVIIGFMGGDDDNSVTTATTTNAD